MTDPDRLSAADKSFPPWADGLTAAEFLARSPRLTDLWTPLLVIDRAALEANVAFLADWTAERGLELMPHGKTTMAPAIWRRQLAAGATGLTVATPWQARTAIATGIRTVMIAGHLTDAATLRWAAQQSADGVRLWSWVDGEEAVARAETALREVPDARLDVLVELGRPAGRTGARGRGEADALAARIEASDVLRLAGVAGYEGAVAHGRTSDALGEVRAFLGDMLHLHAALRERYEVADPIVTAGGSAYPDVVGEVFAVAAGRDEPARFVLRCGAYVAHDDGHYAAVSPFHGAGLRPAVRAVARVVSAPEPGLVLLDAGKRDVPYDEGLPTPLHGIDASGGRVPLAGARVSAMNDQHTFVSGDVGALRPGDLVVLGLSHPCTMFDKWRRIPMVDSFDTLPDARIVELVSTRF